MRKNLNFERNEQMKNKNGIYIIGVDHGYGNIKTANYCFPTGVESSDTEPTFKNDLLIYQSRYYQIGVGHKEYTAEKVMDEDYYILTLAAIARELSRENMAEARVYLAVGLPLSWAKKQGAAFRTYLLRNSSAEFDFRDNHYRIRFVGAGVFPQGYAAVVQSMETFTGSHMLCDIGNGTMNILPAPKAHYQNLPAVPLLLLSAGNDVPLRPVLKTTVVFTDFKDCPLPNDVGAGIAFIR